jgi:YVTN family beta-propeller protein
MRIFFVSLLFAAALAAQSGDLPGMPPLVDKNDVYAGARVGNISPAVKSFPDRVYVPNSDSNTVDVIDPHTFKIISHFDVGHQPQHVVPSYDLKTLWVLNDLGDSLTKIDPMTGEKKETIPVIDPYNMYYTPDGKYAIVVAEARRQLHFRDAQTMKMVQSVPVPCRGVDHMDFSPDGRFLVASCEFSAQLVKVDVEARKVVGELKLSNPKGMPQDVRLSPDGKIFYVADMMSDGIYEIDGNTMKQIGFIPTGKGAHGLYFSRDSKYLYVSNRGIFHGGTHYDRAKDSVSIVDTATRKVVGGWQIPGGGSPDMGGVSADGKVLWLSGRYDAEVYAFDTTDGHLLTRIKVGKGPHGLCVYPQPGRYSLGHTGNMR